MLGALGGHHPPPLNIALHVPVTPLGCVGWVCSPRTPPVSVPGPVLPCCRGLNPPGAGEGDWGGLGQHQTGAELPGVWDLGAPGDQGEGKGRARPGRAPGSLLPAAPPGAEEAFLKCFYL